MELMTAISLDHIRESIKPCFNDDRFVFHSIRHTYEVLENAIQIGKLEELDIEELEIISIASLFHDTGYFEDWKNHEAIGARKARTYLEEQGYSEEKIRKVEGCIMATKMGREPIGKLEMVIKDADIAHVGKDSFFEQAQLLKVERETLEGEPIDENEWLKTNRAFVKNISFYTKSAKELFNAKKKENYKILNQELKEAKKEKDAMMPSRGIETMFRVALRNHNQLSSLADNKANILLSITAIMMSLIFSSLAPKIDSNPALLIPTVLVTVVCMITMVYSILSTRPKISKAPYTRDKLTSNKINLLFFGNFYDVPLDEFEWGISKLMRDRDLLYGSLTKDLYFLGVVLAKKYKYLHTAYNIFMYGLIICTIAFIIAFAAGTQ
jgi:HD superfamily phosphodiesterase